MLHSNTNPVEIDRRLGWQWWPSHFPPGFQLVSYQFMPEPTGGFFCCFSQPRNSSFPLLSSNQILYRLTWESLTSHLHCQHPCSPAVSILLSASVLLPHSSSPTGLSPLTKMASLSALDHKTMSGLKVVGNISSGKQSFQPKSALTSHPYGVQQWLSLAGCLVVFHLSGPSCKKSGDGSYMCAFSQRNGTTSQ